MTSLKESVKKRIETNNLIERMLRIEVCNLVEHYFKIRKGIRLEELESNSDFFYFSTMGQVIKCNKNKNGKCYKKNDWNEKNNFNNEMFIIDNEDKTEKNIIVFKKDDFEEIKEYSNVVAVEIKSATKEYINRI